MTGLRTPSSRPYTLRSGASCALTEIGSADIARVKKDLAVELLLLGERRAEPEIHLIPAGYTGFVTIAFLATNGAPGDYEGNARLYRIPANGLLLTQSPPNHGESPEQRFFIVGPNGDRRRVSIVGSTLDDTPQNRARPDIEILGQGHVERTLDPSRRSVEGIRCDIEFDQYFVGTRTQFLDADASEVSKRVEDSFKCPSH